LPVRESGGIYGIDPELEEAGTAKMRMSSTNPKLRDKGADGYQKKVPVWLK
jgi:hypothetical protein